MVGMSDHHSKPFSWSRFTACSVAAVSGTVMMLWGYATREWDAAIAGIVLPWVVAVVTRIRGWQMADPTDDLAKEGLES